MFGWGWHFSTDATSSRPINSSARQFERAETETQNSVWEEQGPQEASARDNSNYKLRPLLTRGALASHHHWAKRRRIQYFPNNKRNQFHMSVPNFLPFRIGCPLQLVLPHSWAIVLLHIGWVLSCPSSSPGPQSYYIRCHRCTYYRFMYVRQ